MTLSIQNAIRRTLGVLAVAVTMAAALAPTCSPAKGFTTVEENFREVRPSARRLTGPLFWLHGDDRESRERLEFYIGKIAEGHNGAFCAESRPHSDWLGPRWFEDLAICLEAAKKYNLHMWIFDERWWPSQTVADSVPDRYAAKRLVAEAFDIEGPRVFEAEGYGDPRFIAALAGRVTDDGVDPDSLVDLASHIDQGTLRWEAPEGQWQVMRFTWTVAPRTQQAGFLSLDGASRDCVDWFIETVYQPHYDRFKDDFGKTIRGFFYDEPETQGDWGTELAATFEERGVDWKKAFVAYKFQLAGGEQAAGKYAYLDAFFETWGRTMYGGMTRWCEERGVESIGHFMEHGGLYLDHGLGAGNLMQMQKYSSMGGMDLVCRQYYPGDRKRDYYMPKLASSISHVYDKPDHITMCEIFGAYGQDLTYPQMKWLADQHHVFGVNFLITHSFNPRAPQDRDCPPYFYNDGQEPRWPLYRVWADYTNRLSLMLTGGRHVCPVALLFCGNSAYVGEAVTPEHMTGVLQSALFDCDWLPWEVFEKDGRIEDDILQLHDTRYRVLIVPPVEAIPVETLEKARDFLEAGGVVIGYGRKPSVSTTLGRSAQDVASLNEAIWGAHAACGADAAPYLEACRTTDAGGRSYFLPENPTVEEIRKVLTDDAGVHPTLEVLEGETDGWLHVLHRVKEGRDVFLVCNQNHEGAARPFRLRAHASGNPETWDAMRNEIRPLAYDRVDADTVDFDLTLEPSESVLVVFREDASGEPAGDWRPVGAPVELTRLPNPPEKDEEKDDPPPLQGASWVWGPGETDAASAAMPGKRFFRHAFTTGEGIHLESAVFIISADNAFTLWVNGERAGASPPGVNAWQTPVEIDITDLMHQGVNVFAIEAENLGEGPNPAGLIGVLQLKADGVENVVQTSINEGWSSSAEAPEGWREPDFDDSGWDKATEIAAYGGGPWGTVGSALTVSPVKGDVFNGGVELPDDWTLAGRRAFLEMGEVPGQSASVEVNGEYVGGFIGKPYRISVGELLKPGWNSVAIAPLAPANPRLVFYTESR